MNKFLVILASLFAFSACQSENRQHKQNAISKTDVKQHLERANKYLVKAEDQNIKDYISRHAYDMKETGSGLFYQIYETTNGEKAVKGKIAQLNYSVFLLNGNLIYSSENEGIKEFLIGKGGVESGLEEGILLMKSGEKARFIIPSHLAYGLLGDLEKIPEKSTIIYEVELVKLLNKSDKN